MNRSSFDRKWGLYNRSSLRSQGVMQPKLSSLALGGRCYSNSLRAQGGPLQQSSLDHKEEPMQQKLTSVRRGVAVKEARLLAGGAYATEACFARKGGSDKQKFVRS